MEEKSFSEISYLIVGGIVAIQEEIQRIADRLVEKGKSMTPEGRRRIAEQKKGLVSKGEEFSRVVAKTVQRALENAGLVTRADLEEIEKRVSELEKALAAARKVGKKKPKVTKEKAPPA